MRRRWIVIAALVLIAPGIVIVRAARTPGTVSVFDLSRLRPGDLVFHTSTSEQSELIEIATGSPYTHMGIVLEHDGELMVLEAAGPVRLPAVG